MRTSRLPESCDEGVGRYGEHLLLQRVCGWSVSRGVHIVEQPPQPWQPPSHPTACSSPSQVITTAPQRSQQQANTKYSFDSVVELFIYFRHMHCKTIAPSPSYVNLSSRIFSIPLLAVSAHTPHFDYDGTMLKPPPTRHSLPLTRYDSVNRWSRRGVI